MSRAYAVVSPTSLSTGTHEKARRLPCKPLLLPQLSRRVNEGLHFRRHRPVPDREPKQKIVGVNQRHRGLNLRNLVVLTQGPHLHQHLAKQRLWNTIQNRFHSFHATHAFLHPPRKTFHLTVHEVEDYEDPQLRDRTRIGVTKGIGVGAGSVVLIVVGQSIGASSATIEGSFFMLGTHPPPFPLKIKPNSVEFNSNAVKFENLILRLFVGFAASVGVDSQVHVLRSMNAEVEIEEEARKIDEKGKRIVEEEEREIDQAKEKRERETATIGKQP